MKEYFAVLTVALLFTGCSASQELSSKPSLIESNTEPIITTEQGHAVSMFRDPAIIVSVRNQRMYVYEHHALVREYTISTSRFGIGYENGSHKTPLGWHRIYKKIGGGEPAGRVFKGREAVDYIASIVAARAPCPCMQFMTTRIMWLEGLEPNKNSGGIVDTKNRFIYIHGTNLEWEVGTPASYGCVYMKNSDVIELFDLVPEGTLVDIQR